MKITNNIRVSNITSLHSDQKKLIVFGRYLLDLLFSKKKKVFFKDLIVYMRAKNLALRIKNRPEICKWNMIRELVHKLGISKPSSKLTKEATSIRRIFSFYVSPYFYIKYKKIYEYLISILF